MATLTLTIDDTKVARCRAAYGVGTNAELKSAICAEIKAKVVGYEVEQARTTAQATATQAELDARATADADIAVT